MPLSDFWGGVVDRSVPGQITITINGVSTTVPWDSTKASKSDICAAFQSLNNANAFNEVASETLWDYRAKYARFACKVMDLNDFAATLPGNQRKPYTDKAARLMIERDKYKALAGE